MTKAVCLRLAWQTMRKNMRVYMPFMLGSIVMVMMLYSMASLLETSTNSTYFGNNTMALVLWFGQWIMTLFSVFFYFYLNGFLNKNRAQEYGLFSVLGMEKGHLIRILLYQTVFMAVICLLCGTLFGVLFNKVMSLLISLLIKQDVPLGFSFSWQGFGFALLVSMLEYLAVFLVSAFGLLKKNTIDLVQDQQSSELEPKNKWLISLFGLVCLAAGYGIALTMKDPVAAVFAFFPAAGLVIIGTYCLFLSGSITLLKILEKNKTYYYQTRHFLNISNMKYRMKKNAMSLANICILSTMILVAISTTVSTYMGSDILVKTAIPTDYMFSIQVNLLEDPQKSLDVLQSVQEALPYNEAETVYYAPRAFRLTQDNRIASKGEQGLQNTREVTAVAAASPGQWTSEVLQENHVAVFAKNPKEYQVGQTITIGEKNFIIQEVKEIPQGLTGHEPRLNTDELLSSLGLVSSMDAVFVLPDYRDLTLMMDSFNAVVYLNAEPDILNNEEFNETIVRMAKENDVNINYNSLADSLQDTRTLFASLIFIGLFISLLILAIIVLIMYYKQISEGYEDKMRYKILQNVGIESKDIKHIINQQALWMFFLPLAAALIHILAAYPMVRLVLSALVGEQNNLFLITTVCCVVIFALIYLIIYKMTARVYYSIVTQV